LADIGGRVLSFDMLEEGCDRGVEAGLAGVLDGLTIGFDELARV